MSGKWNAAGQYVYEVDTADLQKRVHAMCELLEGPARHSGHRSYNVQQARRLIVICQQAGRADLANKLG